MYKRDTGPYPVKLLRNIVVGLFVALTAICNSSPSATTGGYDSSFATKTNLELFESLLERINKEIVSQSKIGQHDCVIVKVRQSDDSWLVEQSLTSMLHDLGVQVFTDSSVRSETSNMDISTRYLVDVITLDMSIHYDAFFRVGFLGPKKARRTARISLAYQATRAPANEISSSGTVAQTSVDTVTVAAIPGLEHAAVKSTHAAVSDEDFLDRFLEPIVIVGATGVAVYMFFHIRSQ